MTITDLYRAWADRFELCLRDDGWNRLGELVHDRFVYRVVGSPFDCKLVGRDAVLAGLRRSVDGFDRRLDGRTLEVIKTHVDHEDQLTAELLVRYARDGAPPIHFTTEEVVRADDGRLTEIVDVYDLRLEEMKAALAWLGEHGAGLDPRYEE